LVYGVKSALVEKLAKDAWKNIKNLSKQEILWLCEELFASDYCEEAYIAANRTYALRKQYEISDFEIFSWWIESYINNWAKCDTFCNHTMGAFIEYFPECISRLKLFTKSPNRWLRRAAAVSLIIPARNGLFLQDIFQIADALLMDCDDMVQKWYGWMLKVASQTHQKEVFDYVMSHRTYMPRTALRYAIEKMPKELKIEAMKK
jgi:3-methyladenine DNA glycosylase AlkD